MGKKKIKLGDRVKDTLSGFTGVVIGITKYLHGCTVCGVKPPGLHNGKPIDIQWFDEPQLKIVKRKVAKPSAKENGGPILSKPQRRDNPKKGDR